MMIVESGEEQLKQLISAQIKNMFLLSDKEKDTLENILPHTLKRVERCFAGINRPKYFRKDGEVYFNPYHSGQYAIFLYFLGNTIWSQANDSQLANKVYCLNKMLNALDLYYQVQMPDVFFVDHCVGTVLGRAKYGNGFSFRQNCTVGNNKGIFPEFGENVRIFAGSTIVGECKIGNNVLIAANTLVKDQDIPSNSLVFGQSPNLIIKERSEEYLKYYSDFI